MSDTQARAIVRFKVEVALSQPWGGEDSIDRVYKRGADQAEEILRRLLNAGVGVKIIGKPVVEAVLTKEDR